MLLLGSLAGFTIFVWLLNTTSVFKANSFAFVSPVFAIFLGRLFIDEAVTKYTLISTAMIDGAVLLLTFANYVKELKADKNYNTIILILEYRLYIALAFIRSLFHSLFQSLSTM
jgi:drug/metabolite transporter (DMT)-like permease